MGENEPKQGRNRASLADALGGPKGPLIISMSNGVSDFSMPGHKSVYEVLWQVQATHALIELASRHPVEGLGEVDCEHKGSKQGHRLVPLIAQMKVSGVLPEVVTNCSTMCKDSSECIVL